MLEQVIATGHTLVLGSLIFDPPDNCVWGVSTAGAVVTVRLLDERVSELGAGYHEPIAAIPLHDGLTLAVVERAGHIRWAQRDAASSDLAAPVATVPGSALAARRHPDAGHIAVLASEGLDGAEPGPAVLLCDLADGTLTAIATGLIGARTLVVDEDLRRAVVSSVQPDGTGHASVVDLNDGSIISQTATPPFDSVITCPEPNPQGIIGAAADATSLGRLTQVHDDGTVAQTRDLARPLQGLTRWGSLILAASGTDLVAVEWDLDGGTLPLSAPLGPMFVNGYARLTCDPAAIGRVIGDLVFTVREGPDAGSTSAGVEPADAEGTQAVVLVAGFLPGEYHLDVTLAGSGTLVATRRFRVTACWPDQELGPAVALTGGSQRFAMMNWGGAGAVDAYRLPAPPLWRIAVVLVSTKDRGWDGTEVAARDQWKDRVIGDGTSVQTFYEEVSYHGSVGPAAASPGMTVSLVAGRVFGPVVLQEGWGEIFEPKDKTDSTAGWLTKSTGYAVLAGAISDYFADQPEGASILEQADSVSIVVRSASDKPIIAGKSPAIPSKYVWGHANEATFWRRRDSTYTQGPKRVTVMTDAYPAALAVAPVLAHTLCHEIGHNLGLADLYDARHDYPAEINLRTPERVDLMASSRPLPHFSLANLIRLGWVDRAWLRRFDFSASPVGGPVDMQSTESLTRAGPVPGRVAGIEVPIRDGWSYFFEYRNEDARQVGDRHLTEIVGTPRLIVGTDLRPGGGELARPPVLSLPTDVDGDGPALLDGQGYRESDTTNPERMHDFALRVNGLGVPTDEFAHVDVTYIAAHRPQLQIRPAPGRGDFKSPDIELRSPFGPLVPGVRKGMQNAIQIRVHNLGPLPARDVRVHVKWLPFTVSGGSWNLLDDPDPFDVPAAGSTTFVVPWVVPASVKVKGLEAQHFCVRVDIDTYVDAAHPDQGEIVTFDNWAQSNFDATTLPFGSPSDRVRTVATASNALDRTATYLFTVDQSTAWYRVYLGHAWLRLPAGETEGIELAYESLAGDPVFGEEFNQHIEQITSQDHHVAVTSWLVPQNTECDTPREWWGAGLDLRAGRRTWIEELRRDGELMTAGVMARNDGVTFPISDGEFHLVAWPDDAPDRVSHSQGVVGRDGFASVLLSGETLHDLAEGRRVMASVARPGDENFALAITTPQPLS
jgi:hypothetical protein